MNKHTSLREANVARQAEWDEGNQISLSYRGNELAGEVGEACNVIKKLDRERMGIKGSRDTVQHLAEELADVVICADLIAAAAGIDLDGAIRDKFNATSEKHGFKTRLAGVAQGSGDAEIGKQIGTYIGMSGIDAEDVAYIRKLVAPAQAAPEPVWWRWRFLSQANGWSKWIALKTKEGGEGNGCRIESEVGEGVEVGRV